MRGVLFTLLYYMVLSDNSKNLARMMGEKKLSEYVKLFDLTLQLEAFLTKAQFTEEQIDAAENFIPKYVKDFADCVNRQEGGNEIGEDPPTESFCGLYLLVQKFHEF